jgi:AcrR family transcriptional regulator
LFLQRMKKPRVSREARESEIVEAAIRCVLRAGFHASTMDAIAREAGMSVGIIYRYFANKEAIIEAIIRRDLDELRSHVLDSDNLSDSELNEAIMADATEFIARQHARSKSGLTLEIYAEAARNPKVEAMLKRTSEDERDLITRILKRLLPAETPAADIAARADFMRLIADGLLVHGLYADDRPTGDLAEHVRQVIRLMFINRLPF